MSIMCPWDNSGISIHAPHTGRDVRVTLYQQGMGLFQSTRPIRGATPPFLHKKRRVPISIHAPHTGRDRNRTKKACKIKIFQSTRPIRGATSIIPDFFAISNNFNPRAPYGARPNRRETRRSNHIDFNPRAPYGARQIRPGNSQVQINFNPRAPYGARHYELHHRGKSRDISIHAPHTGRDDIHFIPVQRRNGFQSTRPIRGATAYSSLIRAKRLFQSTRPIRGATHRFLRMTS